MKKKYPEKSKTMAIVLVILFGVFAWVYTWREDAWKFGCGIVLGILGFFTFGITSISAFIWVLIDVCNKPKEWYKNYYK